MVISGAYRSVGNSRVGPTDHQHGGAALVGVR